LASFDILALGYKRVSRFAKIQESRQDGQSLLVSVDSFQSVGSQFEQSNGLSLLVDKG